MKRLEKLLLNLVPKKRWRRIIRDYYNIPKPLTIKEFPYKSKSLKLYESDYNCGYTEWRQSERGLEMALAKLWLEQIEGEVIEIGAVSPYYFPKAVTHVCDPADVHPRVDLKCSMFELDLKGKNVLCISTLEHISTGEYGVNINTEESPIKGFNKIVQESRECFITFPVGASKELDEYFAAEKFKSIPLNNDESLEVLFYKRGFEDNDWKEEKDFSLINLIPYGPAAANAVVIITKNCKNIS